jgi:hypothetical protein
LSFKVIIIIIIIKRLSLEYYVRVYLAIVLVSFKSGGIYEELYSSQHIDLKELISTNNTV